MNHLVTVDDFDTTTVTDIMEQARLFIDRRLWDNWPLDSLKGKLLITDFFEPSTRTRLSFEAAMSYLGGQVIGTENAAEFSSVKKGESIYDNFRVISMYCDVIVGRFKNEGEARIAAEASQVPLINGGDGQGEHPTQALIDYFTIWDHFRRVQSVRVTFLGDNKRSRTVNSLVRMLSKFSHIGVSEINFISPPGLTIDESLREVVAGTDTKVGVFDTLDTSRMKTTDVLYVTRSQNERSDEQFDGACYAVTPELVDAMPENSIIMHPLPRNSELPREIDNNRRAMYFEQASNGLYVRMALLEHLCGWF
jgi:aspartate carbamoyltransferase catalytic subunit